MRELNELIITKSVEAPPQLQKSLNKFVNKLESFTHCPADLKDYKRMEPFASDPELVQFIFQVVKQYKMRDNIYEIFDLVSYWYCIALLSLYGGEDIKNFFESFTQYLIQHKHRDLDLLKRNMEVLCDLTYLNSMKTEIDQYYHTMNINSETYQWAQKIGLQIPDGFWIMEFVLSTDGQIKYTFQLSEEEKRKRLELTVKCYSSRGNGQCYDVKMKNYMNDIRMNFDNLSEDRNLYFIDQTISLKNADSIYLLKELIYEIEHHTGISFERKFAYFKGPKGAKKDVLQKWILS